MAKGIKGHKRSCKITTYQARSLQCGEQLLLVGECGSDRALQSCNTMKQEKEQLFPNFPLYYKKEVYSKLISWTPSVFSEIVPNGWHLSRPCSFHSPAIYAEPAVICERRRATQLGEHSSTLDQNLLHQFLQCHFRTEKEMCKQPYRKCSAEWCMPEGIFTREKAAWIPMEREQGELCSHSATLMMPYHDQGRKKEVFNTLQTSDKPQSDVGNRKKEKKKNVCVRVVHYFSFTFSFLELQHNTSNIKYLLALSFDNIPSQIFTSQVLGMLFLHCSTGNQCEHCQLCWVHALPYCSITSTGLQLTQRCYSHSPTFPILI